MTTAMIVLLCLCLAFDFLNGIHDSSNIVAPIISSRALPARLAMTLTALATFSGPFIFGVAVANTIGGSIVLPSAVNMSAIIAAVCTAIFWGLLTWVLGIPSSASHAIIGGLIGAVVARAGWSSINLGGLLKVVIILFASPIIGFFVGYLVTRLVVLLSWNATPRINTFFKGGQIATCIALSWSYGANDAQKSMGIITLGLVTSGYLSTFKVPIWVVLICASMIVLGTSVGGWKLIRTLGAKFYRIHPLDGFCTQISSALVILSAALFGGLVSTTQVVSASIMGVGSAERANKVRWGVAKEIALVWLVTIPATALVGMLLYQLVSLIFH